MSPKTPSKQETHSGLNLSPRARPPLSPNSSSKGTQAERAGDDTNPLAIGDRPHNSRRPRASSTSSQPIARTPARSFYHRSFHGQLDEAHYSSDRLREQTAELASYALSDHNSYLGTSRPGSPVPSDDGLPAAIEEVSEPVTPEGSQNDGEPRISALTEMIQAAPPARQDTSEDPDKTPYERPSSPHGEEHRDVDEHTSLLSDRKVSRNYGHLSDIERQRESLHRPKTRWQAPLRVLRSCFYTISHPKTWSAKAIYKEVVVHPIKVLPAVFLGLLLNILDALSYGVSLPQVPCDCPCRTSMASIPSSSLIAPDRAIICLCSSVQDRTPTLISTLTLPQLCPQLPSSICTLIQNSDGVSPTDTPR